MRVGFFGFNMLVVGSFLAWAPFAASTAEAARSHDRAPAHAAAPARLAASTHAAEPAASDRGTHRGGGMKSTRGGGTKAALADAQVRNGRAGFETVALGGMRFSFGHAGKNAKVRMFAAGGFGGARVYGGAYTGDTTRAYAGGYSGGYGGIIQCVAFARADTGMDISGNAANWWSNAAGRYARGNRPEPGSVLNFRATGGMRLGHVSVVSGVVGPREIVIDHAHWGGPGSNGGGIARGVTVVDVSPANDWTQVRVSLGGRSEFGSTYPTYGFIYNRPDRGLSMAEGFPGRGPAVEVAFAPVAQVRSVAAHRDAGAIYDRNSQ